MKKERLAVFLLASIQFVHIVDFVVIMPLGPMLMDIFNISPGQFAGLVSVYNFSAAAAGVLFGTIADRFPRKKLLMIILVGFILGTLACGMSGSFSQLLIARMITGSFGGVLNALIFAFVTDVVPFERRGKAMGAIMSAFSIASVIGVPLGLTIADHLGWENTFFYIAFLSSIMFFASMKLLPNPETPLHKGSPFDVLKRYGAMFTHGNYVRAHLFILMVSMSMFLLIPFLSPYSVKNMGILQGQIKYMYLVGGIFTVISSRVFGKMTDRHGAFKMFAIIALISIVPVLLYTHAGKIGFGWYLALSAFFMTIVSGRMIPGMTLLSSVPSERDRGTFMGIIQSIRSVGSASATLIAGLIISEQGELLVGFDRAGYLSIVLILLTLFLASRVKSHS